MSPNNPTSGAVLSTPSVLYPPLPITYNLPQNGTFLPCHLDYLDFFFYICPPPFFFLLDYPDFVMSFPPPFSWIIQITGTPLLTHGTLVAIRSAVRAVPAVGAVTLVAAVEEGRLAERPHVAGLADTRVIQMAAKS